MPFDAYIVKYKFYSRHFCFFIKRGCRRMKNINMNKNKKLDPQNKVTIMCGVLI